MVKGEGAVVAEVVVEAEEMAVVEEVVEAEVVVVAAAVLTMPGIEHTTTERRRLEEIITGRLAMTRRWRVVVVQVRP